MCESFSLCCTCFEFDADILLLNHTGLCCPDIWLGAYSIPDLEKYQRTCACVPHSFSPSPFFPKLGLFLWSTYHGIVPALLRFACEAFNVGTVLVSVSSMPAPLIAKSKMYKYL